MNQWYNHKIKIFTFSIASNADTIRARHAFRRDEP